MSGVDHEEDQLEELQALEAIYMQDLTIHSQSTPREYSIWIVPHSDDTQPNHVAVTLDINLPKQYPDVPPVLSVNPEKDLDPIHTDTITKLANEEAENNLGTVMIFSIAQVIKDWLAENNVKKLTVHEQAVLRRNLAKGITTSEGTVSESDAEDDDGLFDSREKKIVCDTEEEAEFKAHHGTPFSVEAFIAWKVQFDKEIEEKESKEAKEKEDPEHSTRMTGKRFFELRALHGVVGSEDLPVAAADESKKNVQWFDESLYADEEIPDE